MTDYKDITLDALCNLAYHGNSSVQQQAYLELARRAREADALRAERDKWVRIADQRGLRLEQLALIVKDNKTALGFDPFCGNEIFDSVLMMRERAEKAETAAAAAIAERDKLRDTLLTLEAIRNDRWQSVKAYLTKATDGMDWAHIIKHFAEAEKAAIAERDEARAKVAEAGRDALRARAIMIVIGT